MNDFNLNNVNIQDRIFTIQNHQVMLDSDLALLYKIETRVLNQAVKRNIKRFPLQYMFQLTVEEYDLLKSQTVISKYKSLKSQTVISKGNRGGRRKMPYVFTEQGVSMLSAVLKSDIAIEISIKIINAFVEMRKFLSINAMIFQKFDYIQKTLLQHDDNFAKIFKAIERKEIKPKEGIFFDGQIFDAYQMVSDIIRTAEKSIILIDNYVDDTVLKLFVKRKKGVKTILYTSKITTLLKQDLKKHNEQYETIEIKQLKTSHDRFLIIDKREIYHFGASLKDLGKKWFAFSKFDIAAIKILEKLDE